MTFQHVAEATAGPELDLLLIGCGLRGLGLLTSTPSLFDHDLGIIDAGAELGVGAFRNYDIESNSNGSDFFGWIDPFGPFGAVLCERPVARLRSTVTGFRLGLLADALQTVGRHARARLPPARLLLSDRVLEIAVPERHADDALVQVRTARGRRLRTRTVVLATGIQERFPAELAEFADRVVPSSALLGPQARARCRQLAADGRPVSFAGASHSAFSVLARMLGDRPGDAGSVRITLVSRSPVRVFYESLDAYNAVEHPDTEAVPDPTRDICPDTGYVHRYSGLRNTSKRLLQAVAGGRIGGVRLVVAPQRELRRRYFAAAQTVIQAVGYGSNLPLITMAGRSMACQLTHGAVQPDGRGRLQVADGSVDSVFVMGMDPYPYRDDSVNPTSQYALRGTQVLERLAAAQPASPASHAKGTITL